MPGCELNQPPEDLPEVPSWILRALSDGKTKPKTNPTADSQDVVSIDSPEPIPNGKRNGALTSIGGKLRRIGLIQSAIAAALQEVNNQRCKPPLDFHEVEKIAESVGRYEADQTAALAAEGVALPGSDLKLVKVSEVMEEPLKPLWVNHFLPRQIESDVR